MFAHILIQNKLTDSDKKTAYDKTVELKNKINSVDDFYIIAQRTFKR